MTKQAKLRNETYARLMRRKRSGETFSDVVDRLLGHPSSERDPLSFVTRPWRRRLSVEEHLELVEADRNADR